MLKDFQQFVVDYEQYKVLQYQLMSINSPQQKFYLGENKELKIFKVVQLTERKIEMF